LTIKFTRHTAASLRSILPHRAQQQIREANPPPPPVIPSAASGSRSESDAESRDLEFDLISAKPPHAAQILWA